MNIPNEVEKLHTLRFYFPSQSSLHTFHKSSTLPIESFRSPKDSKGKKYSSKLRKAEIQCTTTDKKKPEETQR